MKSVKECMEALIRGETLVNEYGDEINLNESENYADKYYAPGFASPESWLIKTKPRVIYVNEYKPFHPDDVSDLEECYYSIDLAISKGITSPGYIRTVKFVEAIE